jgi:hypothetical protein
MFVFLEITNRLMSRFNRLHDMSDVYGQYTKICVLIKINATKEDVEEHIP